MSDELKKTGDALIAKLVDDVKGKMPTIEKIKAISKLAKEIGEDTSDVDNVIDAADTFAKSILSRFDKPKKKE